MEKGVMDGIKFIGDVSPERLKGKRILVRADFNVPVSESGKIINHYRIDKALPTLNYLRNSGAKIVVISHLGREKTDTLKPVFNYLKHFYNINFVNDIYSNEYLEKIESLVEGGVVLVENVRKWDGEKKNDPEFVEVLVNNSEIFVNDAFSVSHRDHASVTGIPKILNSYVGFLMKDEIENLSLLFDPERPLLLLLGGSKFETKMPFIEALKSKADNIFVGGALANDVYKAEGYNVTNSKTSDYDTHQIIRMIEKGQVFVPSDVIVVNKFGMKLTKLPKRLVAGDKIVDAGSKTVNEITDLIKISKTIVWNGPFGLYEQGYNYLTKRVAKEIVKSNAFTLAGGGDTVAEIADMKLMDKFDFVSMAGGAMLDYIVDGTLVGIESLKEK